MGTTMNMGQDIRCSLRLLAKDRTFTATSVLTLAICLGAHTAMFAVVRSVLFKPLPFPESDRTVLVYNSYPNAGAPRGGASVPDYLDRLTAVPALDELALFRPEGMTFGDENGAERLTSLRATPSFYRLVRVQPVYGRLFRDDEGERGRAAKVLLGYEFWQRRFAGQPGIVGRTIRLNGNSFEVVGVMPSEFTFLQKAVDVYVPSAVAPADRADDNRHSGNWEMLGHLKRGATVEQVRQQLRALNAANDERFPEFRQLLKDAHFETVAVLLQDEVVRDVRAVLFLLWGGVLFVLAIGCVNLTNLTLVRWSRRRREMATRCALGGGALRLARHVFAETMIVSLAGGALGVLAGWWMARSLAALDLEQLPRGYEVSLDPWTLLVAFGLTVGVGVVLGVAPALGVRRMELTAELRDVSRGATSGRRARLIRRVLATTQVAIAFVLVAGAGLLLASFRAVLRLDFGFQPANVMTAAVTLPASSYRGASLVEFERRALQAIRALPGVESAGVTTAVPFSGAADGTVILAEGYRMKAGESVIAPALTIASSGYFESMRIPLVRGRYFDGRDGPDGPLSVIVDESLVRKFWPNQDPIGRRLYEPDDPKDLTRVPSNIRFLTVVGVVRDVHATDPGRDVTPVGTFYVPYEQRPARGLTIVVRTRTPSTTILSEVRREVARLDLQLPVYRPRPMREWIDRALVTRRASALVAAAFGVVALLLASIGVYGVLVCGVSERRQEIGIRMVLGGTAGRIFGLVLTDGARIIAAGMAIGVGGAALIGRLLKAELFGVTAMDPLVITGATLVLAFVALVAIVLPSWRASTIDPVSVLGK